MPQRVLTAVLLIAAVLVVLLAGSFWIYVALAVVLGAGLIEYWHLTGAMRTPAPLWILFPLSYAFLLRDHLPTQLNLTLLLTAATLVGLGAMVFLRDWHASLTRWALAVGGSLWLGLLLSFYASLYFRHQPDPTREGFWLVIAVFATIWIGDTVAMLTGMRFGRHRFFPRISPKKTLEGALAELAASTLVFSIAGPFLHIGFPHNVLLGLMIGVGAEIGDLVESQIKRTAGVKDTSQVVPGHGGVLDRIDSLIPIGALVYYYLAFLHLA
ncbi:MAG TPA: phosphatidate cytidylyltransferase [Candidatus Dormibacteraeota bacterium]|jgi:phosphatidate cytidylyltransferase|nr:phosphatidate cytidylyltransferase [Candidatus Dormibacteraeota bacterium]